MIIEHHGVMPQVHPSVFVADTATVVGEVEIGEYSSIWFGTVVRGDDHFIRIGARTNVQDLTLLHVTKGKYPLMIEDDVIIGHKAIVHGCTLKSNCMISMGAVVLDNVVIGEQAIVAAGAVVSEGTVIPPRTMAMGIPARVMRALTEEEVANLTWRAEHYVKLAQGYLQSRKQAR